MSLFMSLHSPDEVFIVTDTLATDVEGSPCFFVSKCGVVPHLDLAVAGTGVWPMPSLWWGDVMTRVLTRDVTMLDRHTPDGLRNLWAGLEKDENWSDALSSTIYHFGLDERSGEYVGFAYRSEDGFRSEPLPPGFRVKPHPKGGGAAANLPDTLDDMISLAETIRDEQDELPAGERIHIGGDLVLVAMANGRITTQRIHRWGDFDATWLDMNKALRDVDMMEQAEVERLLEGWFAAGRPPSTVDTIRGWFGSSERVDRLLIAESLSALLLRGKVSWEGQLEEDTLVRWVG